ncbi:MAG: PIN domain-containing protein [Bacteroidia bacterium]
MKVIVDTNVVVSAILNPNSKAGELIIFGRQHFTFFAPNLMKIEVKKHQVRLQEISKLSEVEFNSVREELFECLSFISEEQIAYEHWHNAIPIVRDVDMDDIAFVALAEYLDAMLWTGDKRLLQAMQQRGYKRGISSDTLYQNWLSVR